MRIAKIKPNDIANGEGICVSVWTQGCPHRCKGCHNATTWSFTGGREFTEQDKIDVLHMLDLKISRDLSILGGEPLCDENFDGVLDLCSYIKAKRPHTKINLWTGYEWEEVINSRKVEILPLLETICVGRFVLEKRDIRLKFRGSSNQMVIDVPKTLKRKEIVLKYE